MKVEFQRNYVLNGLQNLLKDFLSILFSADYQAKEIIFSMDFKTS